MTGLKMWQTCIVLPLLFFTLSNALLLPACVNAGVRQHGKVHVYSLFKEEVIVPMFDLHFRNVQIQGFWLTQWLENLPSQEARKSMTKSWATWLMAPSAPLMQVSNSDRQVRALNSASNLLLHTSRTDAR